MSMASNFMGLAIFLILTVAYFIAVYMTKKKLHNMEFIIYMSLVYIMQFIINLYFSKTLCGSIQTKSAFINTVVPWSLIFGTLVVILLMIPSWLKPFANSFGYLIISMMGLKKILLTLLKPKEVTEDSKLNVELQKLYDDPSLLVNEIPNTQEGFDKFRESIKDLLDPKCDTDENFNKLQKLIDLKFLISKFIWYTLGGILTFSISYNFMIKSSCELSVQEMEEKHDKYERLVEKREENVVEPRVYKNFGD